MPTSRTPDKQDRKPEQRKTDEALQDEREAGTPLTEEEQREHATKENPSREDDARELERNPKDLPDPELRSDLGEPQFQGEAEGGHVPAPTLSVVTNMMAGSDSAALTGHFATVVGGEHEGRYGVLDMISLVDDDGNPLKGVMVCRDDSSERIEVDYQDLRRSQSGRR